MDEYLVSQRQAVKMLVATGLSRTAAYQRLERDRIGRILVDAKVYSRIDVELLVEKLTRDDESVAS
jgi:hypothetical protein